MQSATFCIFNLQLFAKSSCKKQTINISGGTVTAIANSSCAGSGIGGGDNHDGGTINISGGTVIANPSGAGAGIGGGGYGGAGGTINISGGVINTGESLMGAGIGGGYGGAGGTINISGGVVNTGVSHMGAGIGGGYDGAGGTVTISGGTVVTASIGRGDDDSGLNLDQGSLTIRAGSVNASSVGPTPTNGTEPVYLATIKDLPANTILEYEIDRYDDDDDDETFQSIMSCVSDAGGKLYLWLPESTDRYATVVARAVSDPSSGYYVACGEVTTAAIQFPAETRSLYTRAHESALPAAVLMKIEDSLTLYAVPTGSAYRGAYWTSSDPSVATVSYGGDGVITPLAEGKTTISAVSYDGDISSSCILSVDGAAPADYTVSINDSNNNDYINKAEAEDDPDLSITVRNAEVGAALNYTLTKTTSGGITTATGSAVVTASGSAVVTDFTLPIKTLSVGGTDDGSYAVSVTLTDTAGHCGAVVTDSAIVDTVAPVSYDGNNNVFISSSYGTYILMDANDCIAGDNRFFFWTDEIDSILNYTFTDGSSTLTGAAVITQAMNTAYDFGGLSLANFKDGTISISAIQLDAAGNSNVISTSYKKCTAVPDFSVSFDQSDANGSNQSALSFSVRDFTFKDQNSNYVADWYTTVYGYSYIISDGTNSISKTKTNFGTPLTTSSAAATISGIDVGSLADGPLTLTVTLYNNLGQSKTETTTINKESIIPTVSLYSPVGTGVSTLAASILLEFSETVIAVDGKEISIYSVADDTDAGSIYSIGGDTYIYTIGTENYISGTGSGCIATIPLFAFTNGTNSLALDYDHTYTIDIEGGAYKDAAGNTTTSAALGSFSTESINDITVNIKMIPGVTAPVKGKAPVSSVTETDQYTGTVVWTPGDNPFAASTIYTATINLVLKDGYKFTGIEENSFQVAGAASATNSADSGIITAVFPATAAAGGNGGGNGGSSSGGSSSGSTPSYSVSFTGAGSNLSSLPVIVSPDTGNAAVDLGAIVDDAFADGAGAPMVTIPQISGVDSYAIGIPADSFTNGQGRYTLTVSTAAGSITIPDNMLTGISGISGTDVEITIGEADKTGLADKAKAAIGNRPLVQFTLKAGGIQIEWENPDAPVTVSIPYTPTAEELQNPECIVVWYIDGSGSAVCVPSGHYDAESGMVTFKTTHFSEYAIAFNKVAFGDVEADKWYHEAVTFVAARGIASGTGNGSYSPDAKLTRGEFMVMLMKAYGITPDTSSTDNFSDAGNTYYTGYLAAAKKAGISDGIGGNLFAPKKQITRQEMFTLLYNALNVIGELPESEKTTRENSGETISAFTDGGQIASWAKDAVTLLAKTGTISGSSGKLSPSGTATRAEMAQLLWNLLAK